MTSCQPMQREMILYHGTTKRFRMFARSPSGIHLGTFDQAAHAATLRLARMPVDEFAVLPEDPNGFRGIILSCRVTLYRAKRVLDAKTNDAWVHVVEEAVKEGYDSLVYVNQWEGRTPEDSFVVFDPSNIRILNRAISAIAS